MKLKKLFYYHYRILALSILLLSFLIQFHNSSEQKNDLCCENISKLHSSPSSQFKEGISIKDIKCINGTILILKAEDSTPSCMLPNDATVLVERGWGKIVQRPEIVNVGARCDFACKTNYEKEGASCISNPDVIYSCRQVSEHTVNEIIPWSTTLYHEINSTSMNITTSLEINNTVSWTNIGNSSYQIVSNDGLFDSGQILSNQTWTHVFDKVGVYKYLDSSHPLVLDAINVVTLDPNYKIGQPIWHNVSGGPVDYLIFRETDHMGYVKKISILDNNTILVLLNNKSAMNNSSLLTNKTMTIGDSIVGSCEPVDSHLQLSYLTLERIMIGNTPFVEFKESADMQPGRQCSLHDVNQN